MTTMQQTLNSQYSGKHVRVSFINLQFDGCVNRSVNHDVVLSSPTDNDLTLNFEHSPYFKFNVIEGKWENVIAFLTDTWSTDFDDDGYPFEYDDYIFIDDDGNVVDKFTYYFGKPSEYKIIVL